MTANPPPPDAKETFDMFTQRVLEIAEQAFHEPPKPDRVYQHGDVIYLVYDGGAK